MNPKIPECVKKSFNRGNIEVMFNLIDELPAHDSVKFELKTELTDYIKIRMDDEWNFPEKYAVECGISCIMWSQKYQHYFKLKYK